MFTRALLPRILLPRTTHVRLFSLSTPRRVQQYPNDLSTNAKTKTDQYPDDKHAVDKTKEGNTYNVRESNTKDALDANDGGTGGNATEGKDSTGAVAKAKKEFPAAPDPAIGMQDERGGRGG